MSIAKCAIVKVWLPDAQRVMCGLGLAALKTCFRYGDPTGTRSSRPCSGCRNELLGTSLQLLIACRRSDRVMSIAKALLA